jgi:hypothetical protein
LARPSERPDRSNWFLLALVLAAVGGYFILRKVTHHDLEAIPGRPMTGFVVPGEHPMVVVRDGVSTDRGDMGSVTDSGYRWTVLDAATGAKLGQLLQNEGPFYDCYPATSARVWCAAGQKLYVVSLPDFKQVADVDSLIAGTGLPGRLEKVKPDGDALRIQVADGRAARIDPVKLTATIVSGDDIMGEDWSYQPCQNRNFVNLGVAGDRLVIAGESEMKASVVYLPPHHHSAPPPPGPDAPTFFMPRFVELPDPGIMLLEHRGALGNDATRLLSRLDREGKVIWTLDAGGKCEGVKVLGDKLIMTTKNPAQRVIAVDVLSGKLLWAFGVGKQ